MRVLLTNDDGIRAPGLAAMARAIADLPVGGPAGAGPGAGVTRFGGPLVDRSPGATTRSPRSTLLVVAPETVQSATSHGVTFHEPLMTKEERLFDVAGGAGVVAGVAVDGRPADCVKLALSRLWPERFGEGARPDLVISGINAGANCGINVIYSGTVAAALEASFLGVPSIAVSLHTHRSVPDFDAAAGHARRAIEMLLAHGLPTPHECLSLNIPVTEGDGPMPPLRVCPMNRHGHVDKYERRVSPAGDVYYWASGGGLDFQALDEGTDVYELLRGCITVTPLGYDLTARDRLARWRERVEKKGGGKTG